MKKLITAVVICMACTDVYSITIIPPTCIMVDITWGKPDSSCSYEICTSARCPGGSVSVPTGYTGTITRGPIAVNNNNGTYSCICGVKTGTLKCATGYTGTPQYEYINGIDRFYGCYKPSKPCDGTCDNCESTDWIQNSNGGESRTIATCNTSTCKCSKKIESRCSTGYYGSGVVIIGGSPCTKCPSSGGIAGSSIAGSNKKITDCYIPANTSMTDGTGTYTYTSNCYYSE